MTLAVAVRGGNTGRGAVAAAIALMLTLMPVAAEYRAYPTAKSSPDLQAAAERSEVQIGMVPDEGAASFFTTPNSFDDVIEFHLRHGREYPMPPMPGLDDHGRDRGLAAEITFGAQGPEAKPTGMRVRQAFIIFGGATDITESRDWLTIIRPIHRHEHTQRRELGLQADQDGERDGHRADAEATE
ncbi:hypothetical protein [Microvirga sp. TS319]|uniref:hypothetical protein n=1 Tax=Microvirga sp. TS319 TaxID=3241165 RepID=UPI00351A9243